MDGGYTTRAAAAPKSPRKKKARVIDVNKTCSACGEAGHCRRTSKQCRFYTPRASTVSATVVLTPQQQLAADADEMDDVDAMPLADDASDTEDVFLDAKDCVTSSDDEVMLVRGTI